jgi:2-dehydro-3-deoxyphosphogluconate aldolase / (4S)-4-hydroxy-2-oxoglutarate aldolase
MSARDEVCRRIEEIGVVPVIRLPSAELASRAADAVFEGGIPIFEITLSVPGALELIRALGEGFGQRALIGAGTVLDAASARACIDAGARFIVSPGSDLATIELCRARDVAVMPGALTPSEVISAWNAGVQMVKVFPCSALGGPSYLRALKGPLPHVKLLPTGGVNLETARAYVTSGAAALGVGSELVDPALLGAGRDAAISERAARLLAIVREARQQR